MGLPMMRPGFELDDDEQYRFEERPFFDDPAEYKRIYEMGWGPWYFSYVGAIQKPPIGVPEVIEGFQGVGALLGRTIGHFAQHGIAASFSTCTYPIYDALSLIRSFEEFTLDLVDDPGPIMDIVRKYQPLDDENNINMLKATGGTSICLFAMRSSATFISPDMFEE